MSETIRLQAQSPADVDILSALVQDAVCKVEDMAYLPRERRFVVMMNRFRWERDSRKRGWFRRQVPERVRSVLRVDYVDQAALQAIDLNRPDQALGLLSLKIEPGEGAGGGSPAHLTLMFSGAAAVKLRLECIDAVLEDISKPWPASSRPDHGV